MAMTILNNPSAMMTLGQLNKNISKAGKDLKKASSGMKINSAGDDASGYSISEKMRVKIRGLEQDARNLQNGMSLVKTGLGGMNEIIDVLRNMRELAVGAANDTMTDSDRQTSQKVWDQYIDNIDDIATGTTSNTIHVLMPTGDDTRSELTGKADFVFVVDTTGSMTGPISNTANEVGGFADKLRSMGLEPRFGLVTFGDIRPASVTGDSTGTPVDLVTKQLDFTEDTDSLKVALQAAALQASTTGYGGDPQESGLDGIMDETEGALSFDFREGALKHVIVLTDNEFIDTGDPRDVGATYSIEDTIDALNARGIKANVVGSPVEGFSEWEKITTGTGGIHLDIYGNYGSELDKLLETMKVSDISSLRIHDGTKANENIKIDVYDHRAKALQLRELVDGTNNQYDTIKITTRQQAVDAFDKVDFALERELDRATTWGIYANRMEYALSNVTVANENTQASESTIRDADMAKEMTEYTKSNVLAQSAQSMLAQANQNASSVLSLLQ